MQGGQNWAVAGSVSLVAYNSILNAKKTIDGVMEKLPVDASEHELKAMIKRMSPRFQTKHMGIVNKLKSVPKE